MEISVVVPCYNEEDNIGKCLDSLLLQDYRNNYDIIVVDSASEDKTQDIIRNYAQKNEIIHFIPAQSRGTARGRNIGIKNASYDYVAFIDADCEAPREWLSLLVKSYLQAKSKIDDVIAAGGRNIAPADANHFTKAIEIALDSYFGSFSSIQGRQFKNPSIVSSLSTVNALYEKKKIIETGYFDETLHNEAEDAEINFRLFSTGNRFYYIPDSFVWHRMRSSSILWMKNMFRYGKGRARLLKRYPQMWRLSYILPVLFLFTELSIVFSVFSRVFLLPILYFPMIAIISALQSYRKKSLNLTGHVLIIYILQHFGYAAGEIYGLCNPKVK